MDLAYFDTRKFFFSSFFKNPRADFTSEEIQRNDVGGTLETTFYDEIYNNHFETITINGLGKKGFHYFICDNFLRSKAFREIQLQRLYPIQTCQDSYSIGAKNQVYFFKENKRTPARGFKIHIQPQPKYHIWTLFKFMEFLQRNSSKLN